MNSFTSFDGARIAYRQSPDHANLSGILHGGILMTLLDEAAGAAGYLTDTPGEVRRSVTVTCRQPRKGSHISNWWQTPLRSYS